MKKLLVLLASSAEWYEFTVYSFCAGYIGAAFFPGDNFAKFLAAFGAFAAGFLARPLGGIIFGYIGDKKSRSSALAWAAFFMGVPTVGMALLPSYATIGILAPLLLVTFRVLQGIAIGGQYSGSVVILVEGESTLVGKAKAGVNVVTSAFAGILLAIVTFQIIRYFISDELMMNGGWRILFAIAIILVVLSFFIKHSGDEEKPQKSDISLVKVIIKNYKSLVYMILLCFPGAVVAYFQITILPNIIKKILHQSNVNVAILTTISIIAFIITCNIAAMLTKKFRIKTVTATGLVLMLVLSLPMYTLYKLNNDMLIVFFVTMGAIFGIFYGNIMVLFTECLPKEIRYTGFALAYNIGFGIFGGLLPFLCFFLAHAISDYVAVGMISLSAVVGLITLYFFEPETLKNSIINTK